MTTEAATPDTLAARRAAIPQAIKTYYEAEGVPPTARDLGKMFDVTSTTIATDLAHLAEQGIVRRCGATRRSVRLVGYSVKLVPDQS